ncbi:MAG: DDE-type integrase/transposase/recombinase [Nitrososphaeria archaeon]
MNLREEKGKEIAHLEGQIKRIDGHLYKVNSQSGNGVYEVFSTELGWICSCPDHQFRGEKCKHIWGVEISLALRQSVSSQTIISPVNPQLCPACQSDKVVKHGIRHNDYGDIQQFLCKSCARTFVVNLGFEKMHATPQIITSAMQLYFTGESLRSVQKFLRLQGVNISHVAVYKWIGKYVGLMEKYLDQIKPNVGDTWRADELYVKIKGNMKYLFALMDDDTRFWIAQEVADTKYTHDARGLFREGKEIAGKKPLTIITDGLRAYQDACTKEFWTNYNPRTKHIRDIRLSGEVHNNKMERMNGEIRDREKVMRGLKKTDTPILKGCQIFHNYIRPHEALNGETPADKCGIKIKGENKWITLIQNASKQHDN